MSLPSFVGKFLGLALLFIFLAWPRVAYTFEPCDCVSKLGLAVKQSDWPSFAHLADVDGLINQVLDFVLKSLGREDYAKMPPMLALALAQMASGEGRSAPLRALFVSELRAFLEYGISSGAFAGQKKELAPSQGLLTPLLAHASLGQKEIVRIGEARKKEQGYLVPFTVFDHGNGQSYAVEGLLEEVAGDCKLTRILNLPELVAKIEQEAQQFDE